jgi:competence protein ComEC
MHIIKKICIGGVALFIVANATVWLAVYDEQTKNESNLLTVAFLDVGQGDAIFIEAPNGNQVLVDGGPNAKVLSELGQVMEWYDKSIDMIVATHPDKDHIGGLVDVLKRFEVSRVLEPGATSETLLSKTFSELIESERWGTGSKPAERLLARRGTEFILDEKAGVVLTVLYPEGDVSKENTNDASIVMRLTYGDTEVMLTGDASKEVERQVVELASASGKNIQSDILKVGHHGSKTSTDESFVRVLNPTHAVISLGRENKYGHPNGEVLDTLGKFPLEVLRTDQDGTIVMKSDGRKFVLESD